MAATSIEWTDRSVNPIRARLGNAVGHHCEKVSPGCANCYASTLQFRFGLPPFQADKRAGVVPFFEPKVLREVLTRRAPTKWFWCDMSDLFGAWVPDEWIDQCFAVMALTPQHVHQVLTKRPERMREYVSNPEAPFRIARAADALEVGAAMAALTEEIRAISGYPGYFVSNLGRVLSSNGSAQCLFCGGPVEGLASKAYCSKKCKQNASFYRRTGRSRQGESALVEMKPDVGEQGHMRATLYVRGVPTRHLVHRLVLSAFVRYPADGDEQGCHRDGNPTNNALPNLRWGTQEDNWADRRRHGNAHSHGEKRNLSDPPIDWPLPNCWAGTSVENQATADERIPLLLQTPAAVRFLSAEPLLGGIDIGKHRPGALGLHWLIIGGESGPNARPCETWWIRNLIGQCRDADVAVFVKQLGAKVRQCDDSREPLVWSLKDRKGGDPSEWPECLRVREFPNDGAPL